MNAARRDEILSLIEQMRSVMERAIANDHIGMLVAIALPSLASMRERVLVEASEVLEQIDHVESRMLRSDGTVRDILADYHAHLDEKRVMLAEIANELLGLEIEFNSDTNSVDAEAFDSDEDFLQSVQVN